MKVLWQSDLREHRDEADLGWQPARMIAVQPEFVSVGCNRVVGALDWGHGGLVAYGGHWVVCVYDPETAQVVGTLNGHTGQVTCVKWLPPEVTQSVAGGASLLLSGAADGTVRVWAWYGAQHHPMGECLHVLQEPSQAVTCLAVQPLSGGSFLVAATTGDEHCYVWACSPGAAAAAHPVTNGPPPPAAAVAGQVPAQDVSSSSSSCCSSFGVDAWQLQQMVPVGRHIQHCCAMATLPGDPQYVVLATGGTDSLIRLWLRAPGGQFELSCQLTGHENWVRGLAFAAVAEEGAGAGGQGGDAGGVSLLLASASQDRYCRVWRITTDSSAATSTLSRQQQDLTALITRWAPRPHLATPRHTYYCSCEALLIGHEDWVHSVAWRPLALGPGSPAASPGGGGAGDTDGVAASVVHPSRAQLCLLSASQDRSMILWVNDSAEGLWLNATSLGDAGASCFGYYGGCFSSNGLQVMAHGFTGALHLWKWQPPQQQQGAPSAAAGAGAGLGDAADPNNAAGAAAAAAAAFPLSSSGSSSSGAWQPAHAQGGHFGAVADLSWGADGTCLQTASTDQTVRMWSAVGGHWCEIARTQIHGHDFSCIASIPPEQQSSPGAAAPTALHGAATTSSSSTSSSTHGVSLLYASGSEEKMLRLFEAPQAFLETLALARGLPATALLPAGASSRDALAGSSSQPPAAAAAGSGGRALGASIAALGLSNKAVFLEESSGSAAAAGNIKPGGYGAEAYTDGPDFVPHSAPAAVGEPPLEEHLAQNTLWPEVRKLYGHGNDVYCIAASPNGRVLASACRAQAAPTAAIWLWEVGSWRALGQLAAHTLTVTQLEFSPCGRYLLAASRDRSYSLWEVPAAAVAAAAAADGAMGSTGTATSSSSSSKEEVGGGRLLARVKNAHSRLLWGVSWSPGGRWFATAARDQTVKVWGFSPGAEPTLALALPPLPAAATAVAFAPSSSSSSAAADVQQLQQQMLAVGLESGHVQLWAVAAGAAGAEAAAGATCLWRTTEHERLAAAVRRLQWVDPAAQGALPPACGGYDVSLRLAACGDDHSVRVFAVAYRGQGAA